MGLLDIVGDMLGGQPGQGGGGQGALLAAVVAMLTQGSQGGAAGGGLAGLIEKFQAAGLGDAVNSWVGTGANDALAPDHLGQVLGHDQMSQLADRFGLSTGDLGAQLSQMLPQAVDHLTPNGQVPSGDLGELGGLFDMLTRR